MLRHNRLAWNRLVDEGSRFTQTAADAGFADPLRAVDSWGWLGGSIAGKTVLCLAAGGGRQGPLYAAAGARVTVLDISDAMLALDRQVAHQRQLSMRILQGSMDNLSMLQAQEFDIVIQPVSTCYVPNCVIVFQQIARVLRPGGLYISQHKSPISLQCSRRVVSSGYLLEHSYYEKQPLRPAEADTSLREPGTLEFVHRLEEIVGGMCRSGMVIEDLVEPFHADKNSLPSSFGHRCQFIAPYLRIKARRIGQIVSPKLVL